MTRELEYRDLDGTGMTLLEYEGLLLPIRCADPPTKLQDVKKFAYKVCEKMEMYFSALIQRRVFSNKSG